jgi:phosphoketolase
MKLKKHDVAIIGLIPCDKNQHDTTENSVLQCQDTIVIKTAPKALDKFTNTTRQEFLSNASEGLTIIEVVATENSHITGKTAKTISLA